MNKDGTQMGRVHRTEKKHRSQEYSCVVSDEKIDDLSDLAERTFEYGYSTHGQKRVREEAILKGDCFLSEVQNHTHATRSPVGQVLADDQIRSVLCRHLWLMLQKFSNNSLCTTR
jgi:hypothetical protein